MIPCVIEALEALDAGDVERARMILKSAIEKIDAAFAFLDEWNEAQFGVEAKPRLLG